MEVKMARTKQDETKTERLKASGALNPHPERVAEEMFLDPAKDFFDPNDLAQVKYEMLRSVDKEGRTVKEASQVFGFSRPAFYQAQLQFKENGVAGLIKKRPGPKSAHKLTDEIMEFIEGHAEQGLPIRARKLARMIREDFGKTIHPRSIERAVARKKKKT
jgi:transposase